MNLQWIDIHTHINMLDISEEDAMKNANDNGVEKMITIGTCPEDWPKVLSYAKKYPDRVFCTLGVHPHEAELWNAEAEAMMKQNLGYERLVAVGEIGLDYYYDNAPRKIQRDAFEQQMTIAGQAGLPVEIHTRDAEDDTADVLRQFQGKVKGVLHCFTSSWNLAKAALDVGFHISISGVVTFKNATDLREVVKKIPLDRLHVETDAPFLAPVPHRGKKNQPAWVVHTAELVAQLKNISLEELSKQTRANALDLFPRMKEI